MNPHPRQHLREQRATNAQTLVFIADRDAEMASQADSLAKEDPSLASVGALAREHRKTLLEMAAEEKRLATTIAFGTEAPETIAAAERERRKDTLEIARSEERLAEQLESLGTDDPTLEVISEQARRNRELLEHVAATQTRADHELRGKQPPQPH